jgi:hypothetical protein
MTRNEELYGDRRLLRLSQARQSELIVKHCDGIEERIRDARSGDEAEGIAAAACRTFDSECPSNIVREALSQHIRALILRHWGGG